MNWTVTELNWTEIGPSKCVHCPFEGVTISAGWKLWEILSTGAWGSYGQGLIGSGFLPRQGTGRVLEKILIFFTFTFFIINKKSRNEGSSSVRRSYGRYCAASKAPISPTSCPSVAFGHRRLQISSDFLKIGKLEIVPFETWSSSWGLLADRRLK